VLKKFKFPRTFACLVLFISAAAVFAFGGAGIAFRGSNSTPVTGLYLSGTGGSTLNGTAITSCSGGSSCGSSAPYAISTSTTYSSVTLVNGAYIRGLGWGSGTPAVGNGILEFTVTGNISICATCGIDMTYKGFTGGAYAGGTLKQGASATSAGTASSAANGQSGGVYYGGGGGGHATAGTSASSGW
jgi:hypothetical protein